MIIRGMKKIFSFLFQLDTGKKNDMNNLMLSMRTSGLFLFLLSYSWYVNSESGEDLIQKLLDYYALLSIN